MIAHPNEYEQCWKTDHAKLSPYERSWWISLTIALTALMAIACEMDSRKKFERTYYLKRLTQQIILNGYVSVQWITRLRNWMLFGSHEVNKRCWTYQLILLCLGSLLFGFVIALIQIAELCEKLFVRLPELQLVQSITKFGAYLYARLLVVFHEMPLL